MKKIKLLLCNLFIVSILLASCATDVDAPDQKSDGVNCAHCKMIEKKIGVFSLMIPICMNTSEEERTETIGGQEVKNFVHLFECNGITIECYTNIINVTSFFNETVKDAKYEDTKQGEYILRLAKARVNELNYYRFCGSDTTSLSEYFEHYGDGFLILSEKIKDEDTSFVLDVLRSLSIKE